MTISGLVDFGGILYEVSIAHTSDSVRIRVRFNLQSWANTFTASYIAELTKKTGSYKDFNTFVNMLATAVTNQGKFKFILVPSSQA